MSVTTSLTALMSDSSADSSNMSPGMSVSLPSSPVSVTGMTGLLSSRNLVQDEKLAVATLATLDSGNASDLIKQDLKLVIQSRRKKEGKVELRVEFKKPVKDKLSKEEMENLIRRRKMNKQAARKSRERGQKHKDMLVEEIIKLQSQNSELMNVLDNLTEERDGIVELLRQHMKQCSDYEATQSAAVGISQRVLDLLSFSSVSTGRHEVQEKTKLYICRGNSLSVPSLLQSPSLIVKKEYPTSPLLVGFSRQILDISPATLAGGDVIFDDSSSMRYSVSSPFISCSTPLVSPVFELPPLPTVNHRQLALFSTTQESSVCSSLSDTTSEAADDNVVNYKHKLMKYRKQFSNHLEPSSTCGRVSRVCLERSFSLPCMGRESGSSIGSASSEGYTMDMIQSDTTGSPPTPSTTPTALDSGSTRGSIYNSPDLAAELPHASFYKFSKKIHFESYSGDIWAPSGAAPEVQTRNLERRWSVDNHQAQHQHLPEPLNLSRKSTLGESDFLLSSTSSPCNSPACLRSSRTCSYFTCDSYLTVACVFVSQSRLISDLWSLISQANTLQLQRKMKTR